MRLTNVGYQQHGQPSDYRAGTVIIPSGESAEVPEEFAAHLLKTFPGQFARESVGVAVEEKAFRKGKRR